MSKNNDIYEEADRIKQKIQKIKDEYPQTVWAGEGVKIETRPMPPEVKKELEQLQAKLKELNKEIDKAVGLI